MGFVEKAYIRKAQAGSRENKYTVPGICELNLCKKTRKYYYTMATLKQNIATAIENNATSLTVEYKDGQEEITMYIGNVGFGLDSINSGTKEANQIYAEIEQLEKNGNIDAGKCRIHATVSIYDSFGEAAYRIKFTKNNSH
jgi:hypothetical protein